MALDPRTGAVRAMVGGPGFDATKFNLATQGCRQPGSSFKTFVLVAALEAGVRPTDIIDGTSPCRFPLPGGQPDYVISSEGAGVGQISKMITLSINCGSSASGSSSGSIGSSTLLGAWASRRSSSPYPR